MGKKPGFEPHTHAAVGKDLQTMLGGAKTLLIKVDGAYAKGSPQHRHARELVAAVESLRHDLELAAYSERVPRHREIYGLPAFDAPAEVSHA
jgi:hypothetical protein